MASSRAQWIVVLVAGCASWEPVGAPDPERPLFDAGPRRDAGPPPPRPTDAGPAPVDLGWPSDAPTFVSVTVGGAHGCGLTDEGSVWCWGNDSHGQLGQGLVHRQQCGEVPCRPWAELASSFSDVVQIEAMGNRTCALSRDGSVRCDGEVVVHTRWPPLVRIALAPMSLGRVELYGIDAEGTLSRERHQDAPEPVAGLAGVVDLASGDGHSCALTGDGEVRCWGSNRDSQVGVPNGDAGGCWTCAEPMRVPVAGSARGISAGGSASCAILVDGSAQCWGRVGTEVYAAPRTVEAFSDALSIAIRPGVICAARADSPLVCIAEGTLSFDPTVLGAVHEVALSDDGAPYGCGVRADGAILCAGSNASGEVGRAVSASELVAAPITVGRPERVPQPLPPYGGDPAWDRVATLPSECAIERARDPAALLSITWEPCGVGPPSCLALRTSPDWAPFYLGSAHHDGTRGYAVVGGMHERGMRTAIVTTDGEVLALWMQNPADPDCAIQGVALGDGQAAVWLAAAPYPDRIIHAPLDAIGAVSGPTWIPMRGHWTSSVGVSRSTVLTGGPSALVEDRGTSPLSFFGASMATALVGASVLAVPYTSRQIHVGAFDAPVAPLVAPEGADVIAFGADGRDLVWLEASPPGRPADYTTYALWTAPYVERAEALSPRRVDLDAPPSRFVLGDGWVGWIDSGQLALVRLSDGLRRRHVASSPINALAYVTEEEILHTVGGRLHRIDPRELPAE